MCYCDDDEPASAYSEVFPKARKTHYCCECGAAINKGDRYQRYSLVWEGTARDYKSCLECAQIRDYQDRKAWPCSGPPFTLLYDEWLRSELPPHVLAGYAQSKIRRDAAKAAKAQEAS